jgi:hypothetical protein
MTEPLGFDVNLRTVEESVASPVPVLRGGRRQFECPLCTTARTPAVYETRVECWAHMHMHDGARARSSAR